MVAHRLNAPYPPFLALCGAALALLPFSPEVQLDPALVLVDASFDSSPGELHRNGALID